MEINPRLGVQLWLRTALGINEPLMCLKIARREMVEPVIDYPLGCRLLKPIEDVAAFSFELLDLAAFRLRAVLHPRRARDAENLPMTLRELIALYRDPYVGQQERRLSPYFRHAIEDPCPRWIWTSKVLSDNARRTIQRLGR